MELVVRDIHLPLRDPFTTSHGTLTAKHNIIVELRADGFCGYGEAAPSLAYPKQNAEAIRSALEKVRPLLNSHAFETPDLLWEELHSHLAENSFALCALDIAAHDLWGKQQAAPVWKLWGLKLINLPTSNYTIGLDSIERMILKMQQAQDWPVFKIKLGTSEDLEIVRALRQRTAKPFRVDANTGWSEEQTICFSPELNRLDVEFIEQPLPVGQWEEMHRLFDRSTLPLIADESCQSINDVVRCSECFHGINIKLTKAGGMTPAKRMIQQARSLGLKVMAGCMIESTIAISALAQFLPLLDYVDMDGASLLAGDIAHGVKVTGGQATFPSGNGLGITLTR